MKDLNCHDPKIEAYCKLVHHLEDKFNGLELNHIARKFNEATDELAKMASTRASVPPNIFARDLHKPSVDYASAAQEGPPVKPTTGPEAPSVTKTPAAEPEAMEVDAGSPEANRGADWWVPLLDHLTRGVLLTDRTEAQRLAR